MAKMRGRAREDEDDRQLERVPVAKVARDRDEEQEIERRHDQQREDVHAALEPS